MVTTLTDRDTIGDLTCSIWQVAKWDGTNWVCHHDWDTLFNLSCATGEVAKWNGSTWVCAPDDDTITTYSAGAGLQLVGTEFRIKGSGYANVVVVAASGGDFISIQAAIDSIGDASASNPYLVWVGPGLYSESVSMKPFIHLQGAGRQATVIASDLGSSTFPGTEATLVLSTATSIRDLAIENDGIDIHNVALLVKPGATDASVESVDILSSGLATNRYGIVSSDDLTEVSLVNVSVVAELGQHNHGLVNLNGSTVHLQGGSYRATGGVDAFGIFNSGVGSDLRIEGASAYGGDATTENHGLYNTDNAFAELHGGSFSGAGGINSFGISNNGSGARTTATGVAALGNSGTAETIGIINDSGGVVTLHGGEFRARGDGQGRGIVNGGVGSIMEATGVAAVSEDCYDNIGLRAYLGSTTILSGGSFVGRRGTFAQGLVVNDPGTSLTGVGVNAIAEGPSVVVIGVINGVGSVVRWVQRTHLHNCAADEEGSLCLHRDGPVTSMISEIPPVGVILNALSPNALTTKTFPNPSTARSSELTRSFPCPSPFASMISETSPFGDIRNTFLLEKPATNTLPISSTTTSSAP